MTGSGSGMPKMDDTEARQWSDYLSGQSAKVSRSAENFEAFALQIAEVYLKPRS